MFFRRTKTRVLAALLLLLTACSGGGGDAVVAPDESDAMPPDALPFDAQEDDGSAEEVSMALEVVGPEQIALTAGERASFPYLVYNGESRAVTLRLEVDGGGTVATPSVRADRLRLDSSDSIVLDVTVEAAPGAQIGAIEPITVRMAVVGKSFTAETATDIVVTSASGARPEPRDDVARVTTAEKVTTYVLANDTDLDQDLDYATFHVIGGGFLGMDTFAGAGGAIVYTPSSRARGVDRVLYGVCDNAGRCGTGVLTLDINRA